MNIELWAITPDAEALIERAGRNCYKSEPKGNPAAFIRKILRMGHESVIEHASATFYLDGISRACSHQIVRHRLCAFSQESQRYVDPDADAGIDWVLPPILEEESPQQHARNAAFALAVGQVRQGYRDLVGLGVRKEDARFLLPNACPTSIVWTANFREWRHIFAERALNTRAQWEIREATRQMLVMLNEAAPAVFGDQFAVLND